MIRQKQRRTVSLTSTGLSLSHHDQRQWLIHATNKKKCAVPILYNMFYLHTNDFFAALQRNFRNTQRLYSKVKGCPCPLPLILLYRRLQLVLLYLSCRGNKSAPSVYETVCIRHAVQSLQPRAPDLREYQYSKT